MIEIFGNVYGIKGHNNSGKTNTLIQLANLEANNGNNVLFVNTEILEYILFEKFDRLGIYGKIKVLTSTSKDQLLNEINNYDIIVIDQPFIMFPPDLRWYDITMFLYSELNNIINNSSIKRMYITLNAKRGETF